MSIESDLKSLAESAAIIAAHLTGQPVVKKKPGRPAVVVDGAPEDPPAGEASPAAASASSPAPAAPAAVEAAAAKEYTEADVRARVAALIRGNQRERAVELLSAKGADSAKTLPAGDRKWFMANTQAAFDALPKA